MADTDKKPKLEIVQTPPDASDLSDLWLNPELGDGLTETHFSSIAVGKPKNFFRVHPNREFRRRTEIFTHKIEGQIEETNYIIAPSMRGRIDEAWPCTLAVLVDRDGTPRFWPLKFPRPGEKDNDAWSSARGAARKAINAWVRISWVKKAYRTHQAHPGYAPNRTGTSCRRGMRWCALRLVSTG
jgi:hypothetical protein